MISDSLEYIGKIPDTTAVIAGQFDKVDGKDILLIDGSWGLKIFDVSDPANPLPLGTWQAPGYTRFWEGEDMDIDLERNLVFMSVDPRHGQSVWENGPNGQCRATAGNGNTTAPGCTSGMFVVSYANPAQPVTIGDFIELPSGHTTTCIDHCNFLWTGGPARRSDLDWLGPRTVGGRGDGRPVWVTDMRNPNKPEVFGAPIDLYRNDGVTDYSHDVQVDAEGVAWVSGRGGIRGYATSGRHRDPMTNTTRLARPWDPILVAGGGVAGVVSPDVIFMHNSLRPTDKQIHARGVKDGNILFGTEEQFNNSCANDGKLVISDLTDSWGGEPGLNSTPAAPYRMKAISTWHPAIDTPETAATTNDCSAHYFDIKEATLAMAFYSQGTRILDVLNAQFPRQIGYYRVQANVAAGEPASTVWATKFFGKDLLYIFDNRRGVEIVKLKFPTGVPDDEDTVVAPNAKPDPYAATAVFQGSYVCPLFEDSPAAYAAGLALSRLAGEPVARVRDAVPDPAVARPRPWPCAAHRQPRSVWSRSPRRLRPRPSRGQRGLALRPGRGPAAPHRRRLPCHRGHADGLRLRQPGWPRSISGPARARRPSWPALVRAGSWRPRPAAAGPGSRSTSWSTAATRRRSTASGSRAAERLPRPRDSHPGPSSLAS